MLWFRYFSLFLSNENCPLLQRTPLHITQNAIIVHTSQIQYTYFSLCLLIRKWFFWMLWHVAENSSFLDQKSNSHRSSSERLSASQKPISAKISSPSPSHVNRDSSIRQASGPKEVSRNLGQNLSSGTNNSQSNQRISRHGSVDRLSLTRGSTRESGVSVAEPAIMLVDIPLEPVNVEVAQQAVLPDPIHYVEQLRPILVWKDVTQNN